MSNASERPAIDVATLPLPGAELGQGGSAETARASAVNGSSLPVPSPPSEPEQVDAAQAERQVSLPHMPKPVTLGGVARGMAATVAKGAERQLDTWAGGYWFRVLSQVVRQWARDRCPQQAAALAFHTVLSVVPLLAVALAALRIWGDINAGSVFVEFISREFIPVSPRDIAEQLTVWSNNINIESLGLVGLCTTILVAFILIDGLETAVNRIWRAERPRSFAQKFVVFYSTLTVGPFLMGMSIVQAAQFGLTEGPWRFLLSVGTTCGALFLANYFLPTAHVQARAAFAGALMSTILFEIAKYAFNVYVTQFAFASFSGIYGAVAVVPLWLMWIFYCWLTFLLGVELAYAAQNLHILQRWDRRRRLSLDNEILERVNGVTAARVMLAISSAYVRGEKVISRNTLEEMFDLSNDALTRIVERLKKHDLVIEVEGERAGFLPARPPSEISLADVLAAFRGGDLLPRRGGTITTRLDSVLADMEDDIQQRTKHLRFDELI